MLSTDQKGFIVKMTIIGSIASVLLWISTFVVGYGTPPYSYVGITIFLGLFASISTAFTFNIGHALFNTIMKELK